MHLPPRERRLAGILCLATAGIAPAIAADDPAADAAREAMQRQLNERVMATPFNPGDAAKAQAYAEQARRDNVVPVPKPPTYWQPGWTCGHLTTYAGYVYGDYRNCIYYHHYYGRYWR